MSSPRVLLNNLVQEKDIIYIDPISKVYLIGEAASGFNRLVFFGRVKPIFILLGLAYSLFLCGIVFYITFFYDVASFYTVAVAIDSVHYIFSGALNMIIWKRLQNYYQELQKFDTTIGCRVKSSASSVKNLISMCITVCVIILTVPYQSYLTDGNFNYLHASYLPVRIIRLIDFHFYGHLLSLLVPRLRLINYYMKLSLNDSGKVEAPKVDELTLKSGGLESQNCQMKKLMDLYCLMISAYDILIDAIKWQFLMGLTFTFFSMLSFSYLAALVVISGTRSFIYVAIESAFTSTRLLPIFAPCVFADQIQEEVRRLRELLASRLYENKLNKAGRSVARALLALTEARDLSFSLLQVFDIDISLPFKFMGLLLTYLIILLQFEKVINP